MLGTILPCIHQQSIFTSYWWNNEYGSKHWLVQAIQYIKLMLPDPRYEYTDNKTPSKDFISNLYSCVIGADKESNLNQKIGCMLRGGQGQTFQTTTEMTCLGKWIYSCCFFFYKLHLISVSKWSVNQKQQSLGNSSNLLWCSSEHKSTKQLIISLASYNAV